MSLLRQLPFAALAATLLAGTGLRAETVRVQSGEHETFTRLALVLDRESAWRLGRMEGGYGLELARRDITLDLTGAFDLIPRDRIAALEHDTRAGVLRISSNCDCHAQAFRIGSRILVVDITDGPAPPGHPFDQPLFPPEPVAFPDPPSEPAAELAEGALPPLLSGQLRRRYDRQVALPRLSDPKPADPPVAKPAEAAPEGATDPFAESRERRRIAEIEAELLKQLARAGSQGMIKPNPRFGGGGEIAPPNSQMPPSNHPGDNVDAITGVDRAAPEAPPAPEDTREACIDPERFAFLAADPEGEAHALISAARQTLLREFDTPDTEAAEALARAYLYLGFGAEARQVVDAFLPGAENAPLYRALAAGLDDAPELAGQALSGQVGCPGPASFWSMLVGPVPSALDEETYRAVAATASDLPLHLRRWVVPRLAQRLLASGHEELAVALRDALSRVEGEHGSGYRMLQAALAEQGDTAAGGHGAPSPASSAAAETLFERVAASNDARAPEALVQVIRLANAQERILPPGTVDLAEALIFEHRGTPLARTLLVSLAPAYARDGAFAEAFARLDRAAALETDDAPDPLPEALDVTAALLAQNASDEVFLRTLFDPARAGLGSAASDETAFALAARLLALGFPEQALAQSEGLPPEPEYRLMRVRALMALGRNERALASLAGLQGPESDMLRGELLARLGEHDRAHVLSRVAGDDESARRAAWASGDAEAIRESGSETESGFTEATSPEAALAVPQAPSLSGAQGLLEDIRRRRSAIETLLEEKSTATGAVAPPPEPSGSAPGA